MPEHQTFLKDLWPEPDWSLLIDGGLPKPTAALLFMLYQGFATSALPPGSLKLSGDELQAIYTASVGHMRELFEHLPEHVHLDAEKGHIERALGVLASSYHSLTGVPRDARDATPTQQLKFFSLGLYGGRTVRSPFFLNARAKALAKALPDLGWPADQRALKAGICHWHVATTKTWGVAQFTNSGMKSLARPVLGREAAANAALRFIEEHLARKKSDRLAIPKRLMLDGTELRRMGPPTSREHCDAEAGQICTRFRLETVAMAPKAGQGALHGQPALNSLHDALEDLARVLSMPPGWMGLSRLSVHWGTRRPSAAHDFRSIYLNQPGRPTTLSYEWACCLDHHLAQFTFQLDTKSLPLATQHHTRLTSLRNEPSKRETAFCIMRILNFMATGQSGAIETGEKSEFRLAAEAIAQLNGAAKSWADPSAMFSRAFESYVQDRLASLGITNPMLAFGTLAQDLPEGAAAQPYPQGRERMALAQLFDELFKAIAQNAKNRQTNQKSY